jgi:hypothetical protein
MSGQNQLDSGLILHTTEYEIDWGSEGWDKATLSPSTPEVGLLAAQRVID